MTCGRLSQRPTQPHGLGGRDKVPIPTLTHSPSAVPWAAALALPSLPLTSLDPLPVLQIGPESHRKRVSVRNGCSSEMTVSADGPSTIHASFTLQGGTEHS